MNGPTSISTAPGITEQWVPAITLAEELGIARRTLGRWFVDTALEFPKPVEINGRLYFRRGDIEAWKISRLRTSITKAAAFEPSEAPAVVAPLTRPKPSPIDRRNASEAEVV